MQTHHPISAAGAGVSGGIQKKTTASYMDDRNAIRDGKTVTYHLLSAERAGKDVQQVMTDLETRATEEQQEGKGKSGAKSTMFSLVLKYVRAEKPSMNIHSFEADVLDWNHTDQINARANSKQNAKAPA